ncbi:hypothetical protein PR048_010516 [Dryococelus australis]|uniref:Uncharacterized protein n=1 Tax=Dryococelus australis TaxID=614101 RepID=A0ABQ9I3E5_9NEOP|nr:hypothetical protein PR048_010516 [Dryococelus australis]
MANWTVFENSKGCEIKTPVEDEAVRLAPLTTTMLYEQLNASSRQSRVANSVPCRGSACSFRAGQRHLPAMFSCSQLAVRELARANPSIVAECLQVLDNPTVRCVSYLPWSCRVVLGSHRYTQCDDNTERKFRALRLEAIIPHVMCVAVALIPSAVRGQKTPDMMLSHACNPGVPETLVFPLPRSTSRRCYVNYLLDHFITGAIAVLSCPVSFHLPPLTVNGPYNQPHAAAGRSQDRGTHDWKTTAEAASRQNDGDEVEIGDEKQLNVKYVEPDELTSRPPRICLLITTCACCEVVGGGGGGGGSISCTLCVCVAVLEVGTCWPHVYVCGSRDRYPGTSGRSGGGIVPSRQIPGPGPALSPAAGVVLDTPTPAAKGGRGGSEVSLLASHQGGPGSNPSRVTPDSRMWKSCRTMPLVGGFSRGSPVSLAPLIPALLRTHLASPLSAFKTTLIKAAQIASLTLRTH